MLTKNMLTKNILTRDALKQEKGAGTRIAATPSGAIAVFIAAAALLAAAAGSALVACGAASGGPPPVEADGAAGDSPPSDAPPVASARLVATPSALDFGAVPRGKDSEIAFMALHNAGDVAVTVLDVGFERVEPDGAELAFRALNLPEPGTVIRAHEALTLAASFHPYGSDGQEYAANLLVRYAWDQPSPGTGSVAIPCHGVSVAPRFGVLPDPIDLGVCELGETCRADVAITSLGTEPLHVLSLEATAASASNTVWIEASPDLPATLAPAHDNPAPLTFTVAFRPSAWSPVARNDQPLAQVGALGVFADAYASAPDHWVRVPILAGLAAPKLSLTPASTLTLESVGEGGDATGQVALENVGTRPLTVERARLSNVSGAPWEAFTLVDGDAWGPSSPSPTPATLAPGETHTLTVAFHNEDWAAGEARAALDVRSDSAGEPVATVLVVAPHDGAPSCQLAMTPTATGPGSIWLGEVAPGGRAEQTLTLRNVGTGPCAFEGIQLHPCPPQADDQPVCDPPATWDWGDPDGASAAPNLIVPAPFTVTAPLPLLAEPLQPGATVSITVAFEPTAPPPLGASLEDHLATLGFKLRHLNGPADAPAILWPPATGGPLTGAYANVAAWTGLALPVLSPPSTDLGRVPVGCISAPHDISLAGLTHAPMKLWGWDLPGCSPAIHVPADLSAPAAGPGEAGDGAGFAGALSSGLTFPLVFEPSAPGEETCALHLRVGPLGAPSEEAQSLSVALHAQAVATPAATQHDAFTHPASAPVDVLFVVDTTPGMDIAQARLAAALPVFRAAAQGSDYHMAVLAAPAQAARGAFVGSPAFVTPSLTWEGFADRVLLGTTDDSGSEALAATALALTGARVADAQGPCLSQDDCVLPLRCAALPGAAQPYCGGPNRGFLRPEARLEVVFVAATGGAADWPDDADLRWLTSIEGSAHRADVRAHALVPPSEGCALGDTLATGGGRYRALAQTTGGVVASICEPSYDAALAALGARAFGPTLRYPLSGLPIPGTLALTLDGAPCPAMQPDGSAAWTYDQALNIIALDAEAPCLPQPGQTLVVSYQLACGLAAIE